MLIALGFPKPPANINSFQLFSRVETKVKKQVEWVINSLILCIDIKIVL